MTTVTAARLGSAMATMRPAGARIGLGALVVAAGAGFAAFPTHPNLDAVWALLWGREVLDGAAPTFDAYRASTQHPLLVAVAVLVAPLGDAAPRVLVALSVAGFVALLAACFRLGAMAAGVFGGALAAGLVATRLDFPLLAALGFLDVPYCALVAWAAVLENERRRRGGPVWVLLALAGLLRPEAWGLAALYAVWIGWHAPWRARARAGALAATAPFVWCLVDLAVTGDPLFSLTHTDELALELRRERPLTSLPWLMVRLLTEVLKWPVLALGVAGLAVAAVRRPPALAVPTLLVAATCVSYLVIASGGLPTVYRYLLVAAVALAVFGAYALAGWTTLRPGRRRRAWATASTLLLVGAAGWTATHLSPAKITAELRERQRIHADLRALVRDPALATARRCGPITVPNHKLVPDVRWLLDLPDGAVRARADTSVPPARRGVAIIVERRFEARPALNIHEVPGDGGGRLQVPPPGFVPLTGNRAFAAWGSCGERRSSLRTERPT